MNSSCSTKLFEIQYVCPAKMYEQNLTLHQILERNKIENFKILITFEMYRSIMNCFYYAAC